MGIYFQADVLTKASLGSCHPFSSTAEILNLILGFGSTTVHQDLQSQQLGVGGKRENTAEWDNSVIFAHQVLSCNREIALFGPCAPCLCWHCKGGTAPLFVTNIPKNSL